MELTDTLLTIFPKESIQSIIIYGYLYFMLFYYGSEQWTGYSSFEKFVFPVIMGGAVYQFVTIPISAFRTILKVFHNDFTDLNLLSYTETIFYIVLIYLVIWRIVSNCSLKENDNFINTTKYLIIATICSIFIVDIVLFFAFVLSDLKDFLSYVVTSFFLLPFLVFLYVLFLKLYDEKFIIKQQRIDDFFIDIKSTSDKIKYKIPKYKTNTKRLLFIILILSLIVVAVIFGGKYLLKTTYQPQETPYKLIIDILYINYPVVNFSGDLYVSQNYTIKFRLIPWVKIKPNITFKTSGGTNTNSKYNFVGDKLLIKNTSWNTINEVLYGKREIENVPNFYTLDINDSNETFQKWDINFHNPNPYQIEIRIVNIRKGTQLKYIHYEKSNNLEIRLRPTEKEIMIENVWLSGCDERLCENASISLYFEKNNTLT